MKRICMTTVLCLVIVGCTGTVRKATPTEKATSCTAGKACGAKVVSVTQVGPEPNSVVAADGSIWVGHDFGVSRIDPSTGRIIATPSLGGVANVAFGDGQLWISSYATNRVGRVDPSTNEVSDPIAVTGPLGLAVGLGSVWVYRQHEGSLTRIDESTAKITATIRVNDRPPLNDLEGILPGVAVGGGAVWLDLGLDVAKTVVRVDPTTNKVSASISDFGPSTSLSSGFGIAGGTGWVAHFDSASVSRIDLTTNAVRNVSTPSACPKPLGVGGSQDAVWVSCAGGALVRFDPKTLVVDQVLTTDNDLGYASIVGNALWVAERSVPNSSAGFYDPSDRVLKIDMAGAVPADSPTPSPIEPESGAFTVNLVRDIPFTAPVVAGEPARLDVYSPARPGRYPVVVFVHGGPCGPGCRNYLAQPASVLSMDGTVVVNADYRDDGSRAQQWADIACAVRFARAHAREYGGDPGRVTLLGHSNGAIHGLAAAIVGSANVDSCLVKSGTGMPDAFVEVAGGSKADLPKLGGNPGLKIRMILGSSDDHTYFESDMRELDAVLVAAGYDCTFTLVKGADHSSVLDVGTLFPSLGIILRTARDP